MTSDPTILVLDGEQRAALAAVRSLGRRGCLVHVGALERCSLAGGSRFAASESALPDPLAGAEAYARAVSLLARELRAAVVLPVTEASALAVLESPALFTDVRVPMPDLSRFRMACDKPHVLALAAGLGIAVPRQWTISGEPGSETAVPLDGFPVVLKPARSVVGSSEQRRKVGVRYSRDRAQVKHWIAELGPASGPFLVQERIHGPGLGVFLLRWNGQIHATFGHRRIREKPPAGGVSVCCESVLVPPDLLAKSEALLRSLDWEGVAMVEYKHDDRTGRDVLMEVNPRFWGSLQLAVDAGVDFPWRLLQLATGRQVAPMRDWRIGIRSRWRLGEVDHLITRLRHSRSELDLPEDAPGLLSSIAATLLPWRPGQRAEVLRWDDPLPAFREAIAWLRAL